MIPFLIKQSNIIRDFSLRLSKRLADSDIAVTGLTEIGPIRKISVLDYSFCRIGPMKVYIQMYLIDRFDHLKANKSKLINNVR